MEDQVWSQEGCQLQEYNKTVTVCKCDHLTNFGLLFGGEKTATDEIKSKVSMVLSGVSIAFLLFTNLALHFDFGK